MCNMLDFFVSLLLLFVNARGDIPVHISTTEFKAFVLTAMTERGSGDLDEQEILFYVLINRQVIWENTGDYHPISAINTGGYSNNVMRGFEDVHHAFAWYAGECVDSPFYRKGHPNFEKALVNTVKFLLKPYNDKTYGAIHWKHAANEYDAELIVNYYGDLSVDELIYIISQYGVRPVGNWDKPVINRIGITIYSNINLLPRLPR